MVGCCLRFVCDCGTNGGWRAMDRPYLGQRAAQSRQNALIARDIETIGFAIFPAQIV